MTPMNHRVVAVLALALLAGGCWTSKEDGQALRKDVDQLRKELNEANRQSKDERIKLQKVLEQATALLTRNSADVGAQVERMQAKLDRMGGTVEENKVGVKELQEKFKDRLAKVDVKLEGLSGQAAGSTNAPVPEDKDGLFKRAKAKYDAADHLEARRLLRHFINRFADDSRVDQAQLMIGESYFTEQKFAPAIVALKKIIEKNKQSKLVPDALFKIGMAFYQLKFCSDAQLFLGQILKKHPRHAQVKRATKVMGLIKRYKNNRNVCRP